MADNVEFTENAVTARRLAGVVEGVWGKVRTITDKLNTDKAPLESPALTGTPKAPTAADGTNTTQIATTAFVKTAVEQGMAAADALKFKGTIGAAADNPTVESLPTPHEAGWTYKVVTDGTYAGKQAEIGDLIICTADSATASDSDWTIVQSNIDGAVTGPASSVSGHVAIFNGATGKVISDGGAALDDIYDSNHDKVATHKTIKSAIETLDVDNITANLGADKTITDLSETDGKIEATANLIQIAESQVTNLTTDLSNKADKVSGAVTDNFASLDANGNLADSGSKASDFKTKQTAVTDPTADGDALAFIDSITQNENGEIVVTKKNVDKVEIVPTPDASDKLLTSGKDGTYGWQQLEKSAWGTIITDGENNLIDENGNAIMDENEVDLWTTFKGVGFGAERATADVEGNPIMDTYATKQEVSELGSEVDSKINALDAEVTSNDGTNVQVKVTETAGIITGVNITTDETEDKNNKVTAFQATPDDTHYPSEKLVKDSLDSKVPTSLTVNGYSLSSNVTITKDDVGLGNVDNTSDATKKSNFTGAIEDGNTGFVTGGDAYDALASKADLASPALTGTPTAPTAEAGTDTEQIATTAFVNAAVEQGLATADALQFKGTIGAAAANPDVTRLPDDHKVGYTYKVITAGTYAGKACEIGDMIICIKEGTSASNADWTIVQANLDGVITGPAEAVVGNLPTFNNANGKVLRDSGVALESKAAVEDGRVLTLVTTGEKYIWNQEEVAVFEYDTVTYNQIHEARDDDKAVFIRGTMGYNGLINDVEEPGITYAHYTYAGQHTFPNGGGTDYFTFVMVRSTRLYYITIDKNNVKSASIIDITPSNLTLGTGSNNAYYGDKGQIAYNHALATHAPTDSKAAASGGSALSLVTTGEKYTWDHKQSALPTNGNKYAINISGNADSATDATNAAYAFDAAPGSALAQTIALNADVAYVEYGVGTLSDIKRLYSQGKKLILITGGSYQTSARYEFQVPLAYLIYDSSNEITQFRWERSADSINSADDVGVVQRWWIATDGWHSDTLSVAYATNSSNAGHAIEADKATLDGGGADIRGTYTSTVDATTPTVIATPQTQARVLTSVSGSVNTDGFKLYHVNSAYIRLSSVWQKALYSPAYLDENGNPLPKYGTVSGAYVSYGLAYGYNGFVCLGCESASAVGIAQADSDGIVNGYFEAEFDVTIWCLNSSRGTMANPPSTVNMVFGVAAVNPSPSAGNYLRGFEFSQAQIQARMTIPYGDPGSESYAHVRLCGNITGAGYDYRILIGAAHNSRSDMIVFTCAQNYNLKWISNTFPHN